MQALGMVCPCQQGGMPDGCSCKGWGTQEVGAMVENAVLSWSQTASKCTGTLEAGAVVSQPAQRLGTGLVRL